MKQIFKVYSSVHETFIRRYDTYLTFTSGVSELKFNTYGEAEEAIQEYFDENPYSTDSLKIEKLYVHG